MTGKSKSVKKLFNTDLVFITLAKRPEVLDPRQQGGNVQSYTSRTCFVHIVHTYISENYNLRLNKQFHYSVL